MSCADEDRASMVRAIELAWRGEGRTNPNPLVGCVVVRDGAVIAEDYHHEYGQFHAERNALLRCEDARGATLYVTLEPCCHHGKTPPCTDLIIEKGIARVVVGSRDPNPLVAGKGVAALRAAGIEVEEDFMRHECDALNPAFFHYITTGLPYVIMKYAMTLDGKIATSSGDSQWITGEEARAHVHRLRGRYGAVLAGIGTVLADDPLLTCRNGGRNPLRAICDSTLRLPVDSRIAQTARDVPTIAFTAGRERPEKRTALEELGVQVVAAGGDDGRVDLFEVIRHLGKRGIDSVLIEGGGALHESALAAGIVNHVCAYIAPTIVGGRDAKTPVEGQGVRALGEAARLANLTVTPLGRDVLLEADLEEGMRGVYRNR